jgi:hypothetical protein
MRLLLSDIRWLKEFLLATIENNLDDEKWIARRPNRAALDHAIYAPLGQFLRHFARRKNLGGVGRAPLPLPLGGERDGVRRGVKPLCGG